MVHPTLTPELIRNQLQRILSGPSFRNSQRYSDFLQYCVDQTLAGKADSLKERNIGVDVFNRRPEYDTGSDHIVRSAASEIRKRLAQYYQSPNTASELRIELNAGSYIPKFTIPAEQPVATPASAGPRISAAAVLPEVEVAPPAVRLSRKWLWAVPALAVLAAILWLRSTPPAPTALDLFWKPILASANHVTICIGDRSSIGGNPARESPTIWEAQSYDSNWLTFAAAETLSKMAGLLQAKGKQYRLLRVSRANFDDFQNGPTVLIGAANNPWMSRLGETLRFRVEYRIPEWGRIVDRQNKDQKDWTIIGAIPLHQMHLDYAVVSRLIDPKTDQVTVTLSGISPLGTAAAGEFLTNPVYMQKLLTVAPKNWESMNLQVVLSTEVIEGIQGPPKIQATHFW